MGLRKVKKGQGSESKGRYQRLSDDGEKETRGGGNSSLAKSDKRQSLGDRRGGDGSKPVLAPRKISSTSTAQTV